MKKFAKAEITDYKARLNLSGLDFVNTWIAVQGGTPELRKFSTATEAKTITGIAITGNSDKTVYLPGEELDTDGLKITVTFSDETTLELTEGFTVTGFDSETTGTKTVTVTYGGYQATYEVVVYDSNEETTAWYTGDKTEYIIKTAGELKGLATLSQTNNFSGITIKLGDNIVLNDGDASTWTATTEGLTAWTPIGSKDYKFAGTFDGDGHSISGLYISRDGSGAQPSGLFAYIANATIQNLTIKNSYLKNSGSNAVNQNGAIVAETYGGTLKNIHVDKTVTMVGGYQIGMVAYANNPGTSVALTIENCQFSATINCFGGGTNVGGFVSNATNTANNPVTIINCLFDGKITGSARNNAAVYIGGIMGFPGSTSTMVIKNTLSAGVIDVTASYSGSKVASVLAHSYKTAQIQNVYATTECHATASHVEAVNNAVKKFAKAEITDYKARLNMSGFDFAETWIAVQDGTPELRAFSTETTTEAEVATGIEITGGPTKAQYEIGEALSTEGLVVTVTFENGTTGFMADGYAITGFDSSTVGIKTVTVSCGSLSATFQVTVGDPNAESTAWYDADPDATEFTITTVGELKGFATLVNNGTTFKGKTVKLGANIVWNEGNAADWATTGPANTWTSIGVFGSKSFSGTFDGQGNTISGLYQNGTNVGLFGDVSDGGAVKNLKVTNSYFKGNGASGIISSGTSKGATYSNIYTNAIISNTTAETGGILGRAYGNSVNTKPVFTDCVVAATISGTTEVGGLVGRVAGKATTVTATGCSMTGTITATEDNVGGMVGNIRSGADSSVITITDCHVSGNVTASKTVGGISGGIRAASVTLNVTDCTVSGKLNANNAGTNVGGIVSIGYGTGYTFTATNCEISADIVVKNADIGGVIGWIGATGTNTITDCVVTSTISGGTSYVGGFVGRIGAVSPVTIERSVFSGTITATQSAGDGAGGIGGFVGMVAAATEAKINQSVSEGTITVTGTSVGGFIGTVKNASSHKGTITDSMFTGTVTATSTYVGGLVGFDGYSGVVTYKNCIVAGSVTASSKVGAVAGNFSGSSKATNVYATSECHSSVAGTEMSSATQITVADITGYNAYATLVGFDFDTVWTADESGLPSLIALTEGYVAPDFQMYGENEDIPMLRLDGGDLATYTGAEMVVTDSGETDDSGNALYYVENVDATAEKHSASSFDKNYLGAFENVSYGADTYLTKYENVTKAEFDAFVQKLRGYGFVLNSESDLSGEAYNVTMYRGTNEYSLTYFEETDEAYITASKDMTLSPYLQENNDSTNANGNKDIQIAMISCEEGGGGDLYVIRLKNGHFIIIDGGNTANLMDDLAAKMKEMAGKTDVTYSADTPAEDLMIVDAWFITHPHADHMGVLKNPSGTDAAYGIFIKGFYINYTENLFTTESKVYSSGNFVDPTGASGEAVVDAIYDWAVLSWKSSGDNGKGLYTKTDPSEPNKLTWLLYNTVPNRFANNNANNPPAGFTKGQSIPVYRPQAGQKYYFDGLTVEIPYTQEQIQFSEYGTELNLSSMWLLMTTDGGTTFLEAGDTEVYNMNQVGSLYSDSYGVWGADIVAAPHHGQNTTVSYNNGSYDYTLTDKLYGVKNGKASTQFIFYSQIDPTVIFGYDGTRGSDRDRIIHETRYLTGHVYHTTLHDNTVKGYPTLDEQIKFACADSTYEGTTTVTITDAGVISADKYHTDGIYD